MHKNLRSINDFIISFKKGNFSEVISNGKIFLKNSSFEKKDALANLIGLCYLRQSSYDEAIYYFKESLKINQLIPEVYVNLGSVYLKINDFKNSIEYFFKALKLSPESINTHLLLSKAILKKDGPEQSIEYLIKIEKKIHDIRLIFEIGRVFIGLNDYENALIWFLKAKEVNPNNISVLNNIGICYENLNNFKKSEQTFLSVLNLNKNYIPAISNLGNLYRSVGDFKNAMIFYELAVSKKEDLYSNHRQISTIKKYKDVDDPHILQMIKLDKKKSEDEQKSELLFALTKAHEDLGDIEKSKQYLLTANKFARKNILYNEKHTLDQFSTIKKIFSANNHFKKSSIQTNQVPIFIIGMPRSGTTLVEQIISSHNEVYSGGEMFYLQKQIKKFFPQKTNDGFYEQVTKNLNKYCNEIGQNYTKDLSKLTSKKYVTDKLPFNFLFVGFIKYSLPASKIIHVKRNAMDNCFSIFKNYFPLQEIGFVYDQKELANYYNNYFEMMLFWKKLFPDIYEINYEDLTKNQVEETKKLISYCNLEWDENCLEFYKNKTMVKTLSTSQVRQKIYNTSVSSWKKFEDIFSELKAKLKY